MGRIRWLALIVLLLPLAVTWWLTVAGVWLGVWAAGNAAIAVRDQSVPALVRSVDGAARTAAVASWVASGWGVAAPLVPPLEGASEIGDRLGSLSEAGLALAPALAGAVGMDGPRNYLIFALNDAESFASGGAPLSATVVRLDRTVPSIPVSGSVSLGLNPGNLPYRWDVAGGLPWYRPGTQYPLANSNYHPDFRTSGQNMVTAWNALDLPRVDGVITVDVAALSAILRVIGPVTVEGFGEVTADNVLRTVLVDAYREFPENIDGIEARLARMGANSELQSAVIDHLRDPRTALRAARALWDVTPSRHIQGYMTDPRLQSAVAAVGAGGALSDPKGDVLGVFAQSAPSKLAIFQEQRIERRVEIQADGSAFVNQRVVFTNAVPEGLSGDRKAYRGYLALKYRQRVAYRIPATATDPAIAVEDARALIKQEDTGPFPDGVGGEVLWQGQDIRPQQSGATSLAYDLPPGTFGGSDGLAYTLTADPQARSLPATLDLTVIFPEGQSPRGDGPGWTLEGTTAHWAGTLDRPLELTAHD
ncbi:MAG: DUF4012 domain-containing protein [Candidatus Nanopelagicales bacterium]